jgi:DNA-binding NtrC family response regulator
MTHILLVDDEPDVLSLLERCLARPGTAITLARRAAVARAVLMRDRVDLVITDARMPGEDGISLARATAELGIPTILMSGDPDWALAHGAIDSHLVRKPFGSTALAALAEHLLARRS